MLSKEKSISNLEELKVASPGIEPGSGASETLILSIVRRGLFLHYFIKPGTLLLKIFMAMASNITPKNLRIATIPPGPRIRSIKSRDFNTI